MLIPNSTLTPEIDLLDRMLLPVRGGKVEVSRLNIFKDWMRQAGLPWYEPDLDAYVEYLVTDHQVALTSAASMVSTIRSIYKSLLLRPQFRDYLYAEAERGLGADAPPADRYAFVSEIALRLERAAQRGHVKLIVVQDDETGRRLSPEQAEELIALPRRLAEASPLTARRDSALFALALCTGLRKAELRALQVADLRVRMGAGGELAVRVRQGKGDKSRMVPYGELSWALALVEHWLEAAGIAGDDAFVFRGFWRAERVRDSPLSANGMDEIINRYPLVIDGQPVRIGWHDLRRTYAFQMWRCNIDLLVISRNLGHTSVDMTTRYIGALDAHSRRPPRMYQRPTWV